MSTTTGIQTEVCIGCRYPRRSSLVTLEGQSSIVGGNLLASLALWQLFSLPTLPVPAIPKSFAVSSWLRIRSLFTNRGISWTFSRLYHCRGWFSFLVWWLLASFVWLS